MKWIHNLLKCCSFSAVLFTFQACYGTPEDMLEADATCTIHVVDASGKDIPNVEVLVKNNASDDKLYADTTNGAGMAFIKEYMACSVVNLKFELRPLENADFQPKDTVIMGLSEQITITLDHK